MTSVVVAYIPVLHEGYRRFLAEHGTGNRLFVVGSELYADYRPLAKDIRRLEPELVAAAVEAWGICESVAVLTEELAVELAQEGPRITLPAEDVSYQIVERFFPRCEVWYDSVFLRWDKTRTVQLLRPQAPIRLSPEEPIAELRNAAEAAAATSIDWWRQVGAAIRLPTGEVRSAASRHVPHHLSAYAVGDPRSNFFKGVHLELSTAMHAEAQLLADAARNGVATAGAEIYVTDFPCPPCARLIAAAGISRLYFHEGYAVLDGEDVLSAAGVELVEVV
jgi:dCMP deaminase